MTYLRVQSSEFIRANKSRQTGWDSHISHSQRAAKISIPPSEEFDRALRGDDASARRSRKVLVLFYGAYPRPVRRGLAAFLIKMGFEPILLDNDPKSGGGTNGVILNDGVHIKLLRRVASRHASEG